MSTWQLVDNISKGGVGFSWQSISMELKDILPEFQAFLRNRRMVHDKSIPYYAVWVSKFLNFINRNPYRDIESQVIAFVEKLKSDQRLKDWQIRNAQQALDLYLDHFGGRPDVQKRLDGYTEVHARPHDLSSILADTKRLTRLKHYAYSTERTYLDWARRFFSYVTQTRKIAPDAVTDADVRNFLSHFALAQKISASSQNQAFNALLFLFRDVLHKEFGDLKGTVRAKRGIRLPVVLSEDEVKRLIRYLSGRGLLIAQLLYGSGMRLMECARLRVKDIDFDHDTIFVRSGKGDNDRSTLLPQCIKEDLRNHLASVRQLHEQDLAAGYGDVSLPEGLDRKYPNAGKEWAWQYVFPSEKLSVDVKDGKVRRFHITDTTIQDAVRSALKEAGIAKHASVHTLRHSFATHSLMHGTNIREVQSLLGHKNVETTMIYTHVVRDMKHAPKSPLDVLMIGEKRPSRLQREIA